MALRNVITEPDETLRKKSKPVEDFGKKLAALIDDLAETMQKAGGVGLAAPQVGILRRVIYIDIGEGGIELVNPEIIKKSGSSKGLEGCLSCPDKWGYVQRPQNIAVKAFNRHGKLIKLKCDEYLSRCICHEIDHLDGLLFVDFVDEFVDPKDVKEERRNRRVR